LGSNVTRIETLETDLGSNVTRITNLESGDMTIDGEKTFSSNLEVGTANLFVDTTTGNVGIGTVSPSVNLQIHGTSSVSLTTANGPSYSEYGQLVITDSQAPSGTSTLGNLKIGYDASTGSFGTGFLQCVNPNVYSGPLCIQPYGGNVGIGTTNPKTTYGTPVLDVHNGVIHSGEKSTSLDTNYSLYVGRGNGDGWLTGYTSTGGHVFAFYNTSPTSGGWAGTLSSFYINKQSGTGRSVNAAGTFNANGGDYAEYIRKKDVDMVINKGDIIGINSNAQLTNVFSESVTFVVKSTDPCLVGCDTWGSDLDMYGPKKPTELKSDASEEEINSYNLELQNYETEKLIWEEQHENARKPYDRIAFCGQVPVNVYNATPGQYIIPKQTDDDTISYELTNTPTFEQYQISIGKVIKIQEDGRAWIIVKIS